MTSTALHVGDKVRVLAWPPELKKAEMHAETIQFYERIIEERIVLEIHRIDHFGIPYGEVAIITNGREEWHSVGLNHSEVEVVHRG